MSQNKKKGKSMAPLIVGKSSPKIGLTPAVALVNPKYPHNVGSIMRAASCFGVRQVWFSGNRVSLTPEKGKYRLPREERMKGYKDVELKQFDYFFDEFTSDVVPVAIEVRPGAESLVDFEHPEKALYVFGPEDGGLEQVQARHCHRFVVIPSRHCTNLSAAVYIVLYDRMMKRIRDGLEAVVVPGAIEDRGFVDSVEENVVYEQHPI